MQEFSRRTIEELRLARPLRLALAAIEPFLALNVDKEARKDALVIGRAAELLASGAKPAPEEVRPLLAAARRVDDEFLDAIARLPLRIAIPYSRIEPLRLQRMERGLALAYRILQGWGRGERVRRAFPAGELELRITELLDLYARETEALSHAVSLPGLLQPLRERMAAALLRTMREAAADIATHKRA